MFPRHPICILGGRRGNSRSSRCTPTKFVPSYKENSSHRPHQVDVSLHFIGENQLLKTTLNVRDFSARHVATAITLGFGVREKRKRAVERAICNQCVIILFLKSRIHTKVFFPLIWVWQERVIFSNNNKKSTFLSRFLT